MLDPVFGWPNIVRFSWATVKTMMTEKLHGAITQTRAKAAPPGKEAAKVLEPGRNVFGTASCALTRCYGTRWNDEPAQITNFFQKATLGGAQKVHGADYAARHKKNKVGLQKDLAIHSIGPSML